MKKIFILFFISVIGLVASAKVWRVNNNVGVATDFNNLNTCTTSTLVHDGDTVYVEGSATDYGYFGLYKRLTIIGTGYFLNGTNANTGLQANIYPSRINGDINLDTLASGSIIMGLSDFTIQFNTGSGPGADNITITRCLVNQIGFWSASNTGRTQEGWKINKCYFSSNNIGSNQGFVFKNCEITNNIFAVGFNMNSTGNSNNLIRNNVIRGGVYTNTAYFANNIIGGWDFNVLNVSVKNNTCIGTASTGFAPFVGTNGNVSGETDANIFVGLTGNSTDGQWKLKSGSQAIGTGETVNAVTPDRGAFGTDDPYVLSGIPAIPTIYSLTVPSNIATSATTMPITISTKSNN